MNTATVTNPAIAVETLLELAIELNLTEILAEEVEQGLSSDINSCY